MNIRRGAFALLASFLAVLGVVTALIFIAPPPPSASAETCPTQVAYYAYDQPAGSSHYGPTQDSHDPLVLGARDVVKQCTDPLYAAADVLISEALVKAKAAGTQLKELKVTPDEIETLARQFVADRSLWGKRVVDLQANVVQYDVVYLHEKYETLGMQVSGADRNVMPRIMKFEPKNEIGWTLRMHLKDGSVVLKRVECDLQHSFLRFVNIPTVPSTPPPAPPRCTDAQKPNDAEHTYAPVRGRNGCIVKWVMTGSSLDTGPQSQPVQTDRGGQAASQEQQGTVGSPPASQPVVPVNPASPPAPVPGGNNGGSAEQPGQSGTPDPGPSQPPVSGDPGGF